MTDSLPVLCEMLVRVLAHSLWQAMLVAGLVWVLLRILPARRSGLRYGIAVGGLGLVVLMTMATWSFLRLESDPESLTSPAVTSSDIQRNHAQPSAVETGLHSGPQIETSGVGESPLRQSTGSTIRQEAVIRFLSAAWMCGAVMMLVRGIAGFMTVRTWLTESAAESRPDIGALEEIVIDLSRRFGLRRIARIWVSDRLVVPAVIGTFWPVILVPTAMISGVPAEQWRIILAHELAHVRRWDALVSMVQMLVESLLFFNPAIWWLSSQIYLEREACCDALAVDVCGQPISVARTLVDVAASLGPQESIPDNRVIGRAAFAFSSPKLQGELTDRVRRLVEPDQAPRPHVSWLTVGVVLFVLLAGVVLLERGTGIAVRAAVKWMTPKERLEKLVQLEAERNGYFVPPANGANADTGADANSKKPDDLDVGKIPVQVIVRTDDGTELDQRLHLHSLFATGNHSSSASVAGPRSVVKEFQTTLHFPPSKFRVAANYPGRATVISPIISLMPGSTEATVELVLTKGRSIAIAVRDEGGHEVGKAWIQQNTRIKLGNSLTGTSGPELPTDEHGRLQLEHIGTAEVALSIQAPGYQRQELVTSFAEATDFNAANPFVITLKAAQPTVVRVIDAASNAPVGAARIRIAHIQNQSFGSSYSISRGSDQPNRWYDYGMTGDDGRATLTQLVDGATYAFAVFAPNYGTAIFETKAGRPEEIVKVAPELTIAGQFTGIIERLQKSTDPKHPGYRVGVSLYFSHHIQEQSVWCNIDPEGRFELSGLSVTQKATFHLPDGNQTLTLTKSLSDLTFSIPSETASSEQRRDVVIRLTGTAPDADARGTLSVSWSHPTARMKGTDYDPQVIRNNEVKITAPVGAKLSIRDHALVGYRITDQDSIDITAGTEPQVIPLVAVASGGIHGTITRADGTPADHGFATVFATKLPPSETNHRKLNPSSMSGGSQFLRKVPLGGQYVILAREQTPHGNVWAVSEAITIDDENPIGNVDIKLPVGRRLPVKLVDEEERPVVGQRVSLELSFRLKTVKESGFSYGITSESDAAGIASFANLALDQPLGPLDLKLFLVATPGPMCGASLPVELSKECQVRLKRGLNVKGVLIDESKQTPLALTEMRIVPVDFGKAAYKLSVTTTTDADGNFKFEGLEGIEYRVISPNSSRELTIDPRRKDANLRLVIPSIQR